jgi:hypothetical protein
VAGHNYVAGTDTVAGELAASKVLALFGRVQPATWRTWRRWLSTSRWKTCSPARGQGPRVQPADPGGDDPQGDRPSRDSNGPKGVDVEVVRRFGAGLADSLEKG